jgi:epoxyqueuosine reductase
MPEANHLIILGFVVWDESFNLVILSVPTSEKKQIDIYGFYNDIMETRAWRLSKLATKEKGINSIPTLEIQLKPAAMLAGLGFIGHNTLLITPEYGPRVRWIALLVDTELDPDEPFERDLCAEQPLCRNKELCVKACPFRRLFRPFTGCATR